MAKKMMKAHLFFFWVLFLMGCESREVVHQHNDKNVKHFSSEVDRENKNTQQRADSHSANAPPEAREDSADIASFRPERNSPETEIAFLDRHHTHSRGIQDLGNRIYKRDIVYAEVEGKSLKLDLMIPSGQGSHPLIVWIHGGGWRKGNHHMGTKHPALRQVSRGYAVASIGYRLSNEVSFPGQIHDCKAAIRWLRANASSYNIDPERFAVWGSSAGGHLATLLGTTADIHELEDMSMGYPEVSSRVQAVVSWYAPVDFLKMGKKHQRAGSPESLLLGCPIRNCPEKVSKANPLRYVSDDDPPFLIQHGALDKNVPVNQSELLFQALSDTGVHVSYVPLEDAAHADPQFKSPENVKLVENFLDQVLRKPFEY